MAGHCCNSGVNLIPENRGNYRINDKLRHYCLPKTVQVKNQTKLPVVIIVSVLLSFIFLVQQQSLAIGCCLSFLFRERQYQLSD